MASSSDCISENQIKGGVKGRGCPLHLSCHNPLPEEALHLCQHSGRSAAGEHAEIVDHMHLIEITQLVGDLSPRTDRGTRLSIERGFKANDPRKQFWIQSQLLLESTLELPCAQAACRR